jgi:hypothetical protein
MPFPGNVANKFNMKLMFDVSSSPFTFFETSNSFVPIGLQPNRPIWNPLPRPFQTSLHASALPCILVQIPHLHCINPLPCARRDHPAPTPPSHWRLLSYRAPSPLLSRRTMRHQQHRLCPPSPPPFGPSAPLERAHLRLISTVT